MTATPVAGAPVGRSTRPCTTAAYGIGGQPHPSEGKRHAPPMPAVRTTQETRLGSMSLTSLRSRPCEDALAGSTAGAINLSPMSSDLTVTHVLDCSPAWSSLLSSAQTPPSPRSQWGRGLEPAPGGGH